VKTLFSLPKHFWPFLLFFWTFSRLAFSGVIYDSLSAFVIFASVQRGNSRSHGFPTLRGLFLIQKAAAGGFGTKKASTVLKSGDPTRRPPLHTPPSPRGSSEQWRP
jgi:hypothetical protein